MPSVTPQRYIKLLAHGAYNMMRNRVMSISFEVIHTCNANCFHCNWGGKEVNMMAKRKTHLLPREYAEIRRQLDPVILQISGGEPLLRKDIYEIVEALSNPKGVPWTMIITNAGLLNKKKYLRLKEAGLDLFSVSLDFPDERHSEFRQIPGLFEHSDSLVPELLRIGNNDIFINCCITRANYSSLVDIVNKAEEWGVAVNFSAYTPLRTDDTSFLIRDEPSKEELDVIIAELISLKRAGKPILSSERMLRRFGEFLTHGTTPPCQAGRRFLVVNPDGRFTPCAMIMDYHRSRSQMLREFTATNTCTMCYISTRATTEKTPWELLADNLEFLRSLRRSARKKSTMPRHDFAHVEAIETEEELYH